MVCAKLGFNKKQRLVSNRQIKGVLDCRQRVSDGRLVLYVGPNTCGFARLGVSVGRSCGGAVQRNRIKRLLREAFRLSQQEIPSDLDYVVMMAPRRGRPKTSPYGELTLTDVRDSFVKLVGRVRMPVRRLGPSER